MEPLNPSPPVPFRRIELRALLQEHKGTIAKFVPRWLLMSLERLLHLQEINDLLEKHFGDDPLTFIRSVNELFQLSPVIHGKDRLVSSLDKRPIIVANHPLGGPESLVLMEVVGNVTNDVRMVAKEVLTALKPLAPVLTPIPNPKKRQSCAAFKRDFATDIPIIVFPAGYCSRPLSNGTLFDYQWYPTFVKMARRSGRPILPIHIDGENSKRFYRLSSLRRNLHVKTSLESLFLPDEMFRQRGKVITLTVGELIQTELLPQTKSDWHWADMIRNHVFALGSSLDMVFDPHATAILPLK
ncbi:hypothetical protein [Pleomorphochaeta sp. DL1XJH-081]|jgi:putative hemolysin|uniref:hypothetical protein n=1 Tax=Pleomorphochaeta sp. DL1XJH-081 TaxID=3409690 RepID=UPI003BB618B2